MSLLETHSKLEENYKVNQVGGITFASNQVISNLSLYIRAYPVIH